MKKFSTKMLCRAAIIASLYAVMTFAMGDFAFGYIQIRPAEALCLLPLLFIESVPALFIGCAIANLISAYGILDIALGSTITLIAGIITYIIGKVIKNDWLKIILGGLPPILLNAFGLPVIWIVAGVEVGYFVEVGSILLTQTICIYAIGIPLYFGMKKLKEKIFEKENTRGVIVDLQKESNSTLKDSHEDITKTEAPAPQQKI